MLFRSIARKVGVKIPATQVVDYVGQLINDYKQNSLGQKRFKDYLAILEPVGSEEEAE